MFDISTYENATTEKWKIKLINDIEIPTEKEEMLELANIANDKMFKERIEIQKAWMDILNKIYINAKEVFIDSNEYLMIKKIYKKSKRKYLVNRYIILISIFIFLILVFLLMCIMHIMGSLD